LYIFFHGSNTAHASPQLPIIAKYLVHIDSTVICDEDHAIENNELIGVEQHWDKA